MAKTMPKNFLKKSKKTLNSFKKLSITYIEGKISEFPSLKKIKTLGG